MNENYPSDVKLDENPDGTVSFATDVVATIAGLAATEVEGVASMSSPSSGLADMFARKNSRNFTKGVRIDLDGNLVLVDITIVVEYGSPVPDVARGIQENVKKAIETMSGLTVQTVDVHVSGISFDREQRAAKELDEQQKKVLEQAATLSEEEVQAEATPTEDDSLDDQDDLDDDLDDIEDEPDEADDEVKAAEEEEAREE